MGAVIIKRQRADRGDGSVKQVSTGKHWPGTVKESTISYRVFRFEKYTRPILGELPIGKIRAMMAKDFYKEIERQGAGANTVAAVKNDLVNMTNKAVACEIHDGSNPFAIVKVDTPRRVSISATTRENCHLPWTN